MPDIGRCDPRIKSLVVSFFRHREVKYVRLPLSGKSENVNLKSYKHDLAVWFRVETNFQSMS